MSYGLHEASYQDVTVGLVGRLRFYGYKPGEKGPAFLANSEAGTQIPPDTETYRYLPRGGCIALRDWLSEQIRLYDEANPPAPPQGTHELVDPLGRHWRQDILLRRWRNGETEELLTFEELLNRHGSLLPLYRGDLIRVGEERTE